MNAMKLSVAAALRAARKDVAVVRTGPVANGYAGARVNTYDRARRAWLEGRPTYYAQARAWAKRAVAVRALELLGWDPLDAKARLDADLWKWPGLSAEAIVRALVA